MGERRYQKLTLDQQQHQKFQKKTKKILKNLGLEDLLDIVDDRDLELDGIEERRIAHIINTADPEILQRSLEELQNIVIAIKKNRDADRLQEFCRQIITLIQKRQTFDLTLKCACEHLPFSGNLHFRPRVQRVLKNLFHPDSAENLQLLAPEEGETPRIELGNARDQNLIGAFQLGIAYLIGSQILLEEEDFISQFHSADKHWFPETGNHTKPAHRYGSFTFSSYAYNAFGYFREVLGIKPEDFLNEICIKPWIQLAEEAAGASGSKIYLTGDGQYIVKSMFRNEKKFLQQILQQYCLSLSQTDNRVTLLPKFLGLYELKKQFTSTTLLIMRNFLPSKLPIQKYDLKGSSKKKCPPKRKKHTALRDVNFEEDYPDGILLMPDTYDSLMETIGRDCNMLKNLRIMDYSLMLGVHKLLSPDQGCTAENLTGLSSFRDVSLKHDGVGYQLVNDSDRPFGEVMLGWNEKGEELLLFVGMIDILQTYSIWKKIEFIIRRAIFRSQKEKTSVCDPEYYANRFQAFLKSSVFKKKDIDNLDDQSEIPKSGRENTAYTETFETTVHWKQV